MIRDIGQRGHEKRRKSGIVQGRGKAGGGGGGGGVAKKKNWPSPPPPPSPPSREPELFLISISCHDILALYLG